MASVKSGKSGKSDTRDKRGTSDKKIAHPLRVPYSLLVKYDV